MCLLDFLYRQYVYFGCNNKCKRTLQPIHNLTTERTNLIVESDQPPLTYFDYLRDTYKESIPSFAMTNVQSKPSLCYDFRDQTWDLQGFTFIKHIGEGAFGSVVLARHNTSGKTLVVKTVKSHYEAAKREITIHSSLICPHILRFLGYFNSEDNFYLFLQAAEGGDLYSELATQGRLKESVVRSYIFQLCSAIQTLRENWIVHRDVKAENVLLTAVGKLKLADFGTAKVISKSR